VSRAESIRQFALLPDDFTIERDELTATLKVRRHVVQDHYRTVIDAMYDTTEGADARTSTDLHDAHPVSSGRNG
jgi:long-chain acyl-CoA synthetase